jgi:hypothetical protein
MRGRRRKKNHRSSIHEPWLRIIAEYRFISWHQMCMKLPQPPDDVRHKRKMIDINNFRTLPSGTWERKSEKYFVNTTTGWRASERARTTWNVGNVLNDKFSIEQLSSNNAQHFNSSPSVSVLGFLLFIIPMWQQAKTRSKQNARTDYRGDPDPSSASQKSFSCSVAEFFSLSRLANSSGGVN